MLGILQGSDVGSETTPYINQGKGDILAQNPESLHPKSCEEGEHAFGASTRSTATIRSMQPNLTDCRVHQKYLELEAKVQLVQLGIEMHTIMLRNQE